MSVYFAQWLEKNMNYRNLKVKEVADLIGVSRRSVYKWLSGNVEPKESNIEKINLIFAVKSVEDGELDEQ